MDAGRSWNIWMKDNFCLHFSVLSAQRTVFFWTSAPGLDIDPLRFPVMQIFSVFQVFLFDSQTPGVPGQLGRNDDLDVITRPIDHCILLIVNEGCHRFSIPLPSASSVPLNTHLIWKSFGVTHSRTWILWCKASLV